MSWSRAALIVLVFSVGSRPVSAQVRAKPQSAKGGETLGEPWAEVPETFRHLELPDWPVPADRGRWEQVDRPRTREVLVNLLGEMPPRPDPAKVEVVSREEYDGYTLERFRFHNGVDAVVPGVLLLPKGRKGSAPAVVGMHGHGSSKENVLINEKSHERIGPELARRGYVVAAIDSYFCGERKGQGPAGRLDKARPVGEEESLMKLNLLFGRTLWGMMVRDEQCLIDYLQTRPEVDKGRIGVTGMSMGCTRSWWLAAVDDRAKAVVGVACFTRYTELIAHGNLRRHGVYYFVPGVLTHFDTEAIYALIAPRPMLMLSGDQDGGAPADGIEVLERKLGAVYRMFGKPDDFRSVIYEQTGHEYLPEMKAEMLAWFEKHLPAGD